jgi:hypothetical protein
MSTIDSQPITPNRQSVASVALRFGLILGIVSILVAVIKFSFMENPMDNDWVNTIINLGLGVAGVVFAHKYFKDKGNGYMSYGQGLGIGVLVIGISTILTAIFLFVYFNYIDPSVWEGMFDQIREKMEAQNQQDEAIEMALSITRKMFWPIVLISGFFWGLIIGLIVSIFTQNKEPETAF